MATKDQIISVIQRLNQIINPHDNFINFDEFSKQVSELVHFLETYIRENANNYKDKQEFIITILKVLPTYTSHLRNEDNLRKNLSQISEDLQTILTKLTFADIEEQEAKNYEWLDIEELTAIIINTLQQQPGLELKEIKNPNTDMTIATLVDHVAILHQPLSPLNEDEANILDHLNKLNHDFKTNLEEQNINCIFGFWNNNQEYHWRLVTIILENLEITTQRYWDPLKKNPSTLSAINTEFRNSVNPFRDDIDYVYPELQASALENIALWSCSYLSLGVLFCWLVEHYKYIDKTHPQYELIEKITQAYKNIRSNKNSADEVKILTEMLAANTSLLANEYNIELKPRPKASSLTLALDAVLEKSPTEDKLRIGIILYENVLKTLLKIKKLLKFNQEDFNAQDLTDIHILKQDARLYRDFLRENAELQAKNEFQKLILKDTCDAYEDNDFNNEILIGIAVQIELNITLEQLSTIDDERVALKHEQIIDLLKAIPNLTHCIKKLDDRLDQYRLSNESKMRSLRRSTIKATSSSVHLDSPPPTLSELLSEKKAVLPLTFKTDLLSVSREIACNWANRYVLENHFQINNILEVLNRGEGDGLGRAMKTDEVNTCLVHANISEAPGPHKNAEERYRALHDLADYFLYGYPRDKKDIIHQNSRKAILCLALASIIPGLSADRCIETVIEIAHHYDPAMTNRKSSSLPFGGLFDDDISDAKECLIYLRYALELAKKTNSSLIPRIHEFIARVLISQTKDLTKINETEGPYSATDWFEKFTPQTTHDCDLYFALYLYSLSLQPAKKGIYYQQLRQGDGLAILTLFLRGYDYPFITSLLADTYRAHLEVSNNTPEDTTLEQAWKALFVHENQRIKEPLESLKQTDMHASLIFFQGIRDLFHCYQDLDDNTNNNDDRYLKPFQIPKSRLADVGWALIAKIHSHSHTGVTRSGIYERLIRLYKKSSLQHLLHDAVYCELLNLIEKPHADKNKIFQNITEHLEKIITLNALRQTQAKENSGGTIAIDKIQSISQSWDRRTAEIQQLIKFWKILSDALKSAPIDAQLATTALMQLAVFYQRPEHLIPIPHKADTARIILDGPFSAMIPRKIANSVAPKPAAPPAAAPKAPTSTYSLKPVATKKAAVSSPSSTAPVVIPGLSYIKAIDNGNCLYQSVAMYVNKDINELRKEVANDIEAHLENYEAYITPPQGRSLQQHINEIRNGKEWAGNIEIDILMIKYQQPIVAITVDKRISNLFNLFDAAGRLRFKGEPIFVYYNNINHYDALILDNSRTAQEIFDELLALPINKDQLRSAAETSLPATHSAPAVIAIASTPNPQPAAPSHKPKASPAAKTNADPTLKLSVPGSKTSPSASPSSSDSEEKELINLKPSVKPPIIQLSNKPRHTKKWRKDKLPEQADEEIRNILNLLYRLTGGRWYRDGDGNIVFPNLVEFGDFTLRHGPKGTYRVTHRLLKILLRQRNYDGKFMPTQLPPGFKLGEYTWTGHIGRFIRRNYLWFVVPVPIAETTLFISILSTKPWHDALHKFIKEVIYAAFESAIGPTNSDRLIKQIFSIVLGIITDGGVVTAVFTMVTTLYFLYALAYPSLFQDSPDSDAIRYNPENQRFQVLYGQRRHLIETPDVVKLIPNTLHTATIEQGEEFPLPDVAEPKSQTITISSAPRLGAMTTQGSNPGIQTFITENMIQRFNATHENLEIVISALNGNLTSDPNFSEVEAYTRLQRSDPSLLGKLAAACKNLNDAIGQFKLEVKNNPNLELSEKMQEQINQADYLGKRIINAFKSNKATATNINSLISAADNLKDALGDLQRILSLEAIEAATKKVRNAFNGFSFLKPKPPSDEEKALIPSQTTPQLDAIAAQLELCSDQLDAIENPAAPPSPRP